MDTNSGIWIALDSVVRSAEDGQDDQAEEDQCPSGVLQVEPWVFDKHKEQLYKV